MTENATAEPLFMIQLQPDPVRAGLWIAGEGLSKRGADDGYGWHALLKAAFGELAPQPFRIIDHPRKPPQLLGYTRANLSTLRDHAETFAEPAVAAALGLDSLAAKRMPDCFATDQRLGFEVRVRPTIRQHLADDRTRNRERDVFLAAAEKAGPRATRTGLDRATVYAEWLGGRLGAYGARLIEARPLALRRTRVSRRNGKRELVGDIEGPDAVFEGILKVTCPDAFRRLLGRGVGRHRAFGFGMLLLRPAPSE